MIFAFTVASLGRRQLLPLVGEQAFAHLGFLRGVVAVGLGVVVGLAIGLAGLIGIGRLIAGLVTLGGLVALAGLRDYAAGAAVPIGVGIGGLGGLAGLRVVTIPHAAAQLNGDPVVPQAVLQRYRSVLNFLARRLFVGLDDHRLPVDGVAVVNPVFLHQNLQDLPRPPGVVHFGVVPVRLALCLVPGGGVRLHQHIVVLAAALVKLRQPGDVHVPGVTFTRFGNFYIRKFLVRNGTGVVKKCYFILCHGEGQVIPSRLIHGHLLAALHPVQVEGGFLGVAILNGRITIRTDVLGVPLAAFILPVIRVGFRVLRNLLILFQRPPLVHLVVHLVGHGGGNRGVTIRIRGVLHLALCAGRIRLL